MADALTGGRQYQHNVPGRQPGTPPPDYRSRANSDASRRSSPPPYEFTNTEQELAGMTSRSDAGRVEATESTISKSEAEAIWKQTIKLFSQVISSNQSGLRDYFSKLGMSDTIATLAGSLFNDIEAHVRPLADNPTSLPMPLQFQDAIQRADSHAQSLGEDGIKKSLENARTAREKLSQLASDVSRQHVKEQTSQMTSNTNSNHS